MDVHNTCRPRHVNNNIVTIHDMRISCLHLLSELYLLFISSARASLTLSFYSHLTMAMPCPVPCLHFPFVSLLWPPGPCFRFSLSLSSLFLRCLWGARDACVCC